MKRLLCLLAAVMLLVGCSAPRLRTGYYTASLEETDSMPFYFCLESGGEGYLHAMGQEIPVQWTEAGLQGDFSDCIPTREGMEFPNGDGTTALTWSRELPPEYQNDLPPEYYISQMED